MTIYLNQSELQFELASYDFNRSEEQEQEIYEAAALVANRSDDGYHYDGQSGRLVQVEEAVEDGEVIEWSILDVSIENDKLKVTFHC